MGLLVKLTRKEIEELNRIIDSNKDLRTLTLHIDGSSGIGQSIIIEYTTKIDITDYDSW